MNGGGVYATVPHTIGVTIGFSWEGWRPPSPSRSIQFASVVMRPQAAQTRASGVAVAALARRRPHHKAADGDAADDDRIGAQARAVADHGGANRPG